MTYYQNIIETANYIIKYFGEQIDYAVVLGSGITLELEDQQELGYEAIPLFQETSPLCKQTCGLFRSTPLVSPPFAYANAHLSHFQKRPSPFTKLYSALIINILQ